MVLQGVVTPVSLPAIAWEREATMLDTPPRRMETWLQKHGYMRNRNIFWSWYEPKNFGDWIGPYLFYRFTGKRPLYCASAIQPKTDCLFAVGSILRHLKHPDCVTVWGSGIISRNDTFARPKKVLAVRGPETREVMLKLGYSCPEVYGDPGVLLPLLIQAPPKKALQIGIIPHFIEYSEYTKVDWKDHKIIDVAKPVEEVALEIASCAMTYSSSLHGLIVSHAFGVPSIWMASSKPLDGDDVKFEDYFASCGVSVAKRNSLLQFSFCAADEALATQPSHDKLRHSLIQAFPKGWKILDDRR